MSRFIHLANFSLNFSILLFVIRARNVMCKCIYNISTVSSVSVEVVNRIEFVGKKKVACNPCQSPPSLTILVPLFNKERSLSRVVHCDDTRWSFENM